MPLSLLLASIPTLTMGSLRSVARVAGALGTACLIGMLVRCGLSTDGEAGCGCC